MKILKCIAFVAISFVSVPLLIEAALLVYRAYMWTAEHIFSWQTRDAAMFGLFATLLFSMPIYMVLISLLNDYEKDEEDEESL